MYGTELILDIHDCNVAKFTRAYIEVYLETLCKDIIDMQRADLHWWDYDGYPEEYNAAPPHLKGVSCVQFITTSTITIHTLEDMGKVFVNIFTCKEFDTNAAMIFTINYFSGTLGKKEIVERI